MDYRVERVLIRLSQAIDGFDPMEGIDPAELCWHATDVDANTIGLTPLSEFYVAGFSGYSEPEKWQPASVGLQTVRGLLKHYRRIIAAGEDPLMRRMDVIQRKIDLLDSVEVVLHEAETRGVDFCMVATE
jgi:hypothetical protein